MDMCVDLTSPGIVVLDTTVVPDVVGLRTFDDRAPVVRVLPSDFGNTVRVLVPDVRAEPSGFHDLLIDNLSGSKTCHVRPASTGDLIELKRRWPCSLLSAVTKSLTASLATVAQGTVPSVVFTSIPVCPVTSEIFTCLWVSYGGALFHGALCGREPPRIVLTTYDSDTTPTPLWWQKHLANTLGPGL